MSGVEGALHALSGALERVVGLGPAAGAVLAAAGVLGLTIATRQRRALAVAGGAALGALVAAAAAPALRMHVALPAGWAAALGAAAGAIGGGAVGLLASREIEAAFASFAGGLLLAAGLVAALGARPLAREIAGRPLVLVAFAIVVGVAGTAYQVARPARADAPTEVER